MSHIRRHATPYYIGTGAVLSEQHGTTATSACKGDNLFVRAKVTSSKVKQNAVVVGEHEAAWTQPVQPQK